MDEQRNSNQQSGLRTAQFSKSRPSPVQIARLRRHRALRHRVFDRDHGVCASCGWQHGPWDINEKWPRSRGGGVQTNGLYNLETLCSVGSPRNCHRRHTNRLIYGRND